MNYLRNSRKYFTVFMFLFFCAFQYANAQVQTAKPGVSMIANSGGFYQYLPQGYNPTGTTTYPLIIMLHGIGELGDGTASKLPMVLRNGVPRQINAGAFPTSISYNGQAFKFIVITPQFKKWPSAADIGGVISYCQSHYKVDNSRIYLTGISMGGGALWTAISTPAIAAKVAAAVVFAGAWSPNQTSANVIADNNIGVWAFHNDRDGTVSSTNTINWVKDILYRKSTAPVKKTIFSSTAHDCWTNIYPGAYKENYLNIYQFMLKFKKGTTTSTASSSQTATISKPTTFYASAGPDQYIKLPVNSVTVNGKATDVGGKVSKYLWTKISGPAQYTIKTNYAASTVISNLTAGTYTFRLTVTDASGVYTSDAINIYVSNATTASTAVATTTSATKTGSVSLSSVSVSPNPITDKFVLTVNTDQTGTMKAVMVNSSGASVKTFYLQKSTAGVAQSYLSAGDVPAGNYTIKVSVGSFSNSTAVVKQ